MLVRRAVVVSRLIVVLALALTPVSAQEKRQEDKRQEEMKLKKPELAQYQALSTLVDAVMAGKEPAPADVKLKFHSHYVKSTANVYIPYVLEISGGTFSSFPVAVYVRAVAKGETTAPAADAKPNYAFNDIYFINDAKRIRSTGSGTSEFSRGLQLPPGEFDVYFAMAETPPRNKGAAPKRVVHVESVSVPNLNGSLTTSSVILAKSLDDGPQQVTAEQQLDEPFTFGGYRIAPLFASTISKTGELLFVMFIYNEAAAPTGKPDVDVEYFFYRASEQKPFSKAATTTFNATTLPAEFNLGAGHQLVLGQGIPLASFAPGDYRLELRITDKVASQNITRNVPFTVTE